jgi:hypothetical protein
VNSDDVRVRPLIVDDLDWVVDLAAQRAEQRQNFAPRFWRRASDARSAHARHLHALIEQGVAAAFRTDRMFAFAVPGPEFVLVDDAAAECDESWATQGPALFRRLIGESRVRFVCPVPEADRAALAAELGLRRAETWWHRDLYPPSADSRDAGPVQVRGARGRLVTAPPVYAPGGPVLLVTEFHDRRALDEVEREAVRRGAVVSVVALFTEDATREEVLLARGYRRTCDFYEGVLTQVT